MGEESVTEEEFNALFRANYGRVNRLARSLVGPTNAEDVTQEVMIRAFRHIGVLDPARPVWPWLAVVTQNAAYDHHRRNRADTTALPDDLERIEGPHDVLAQVIRSDSRARLSRALGRMPVFDRMLLTRHEIEGVPVATLARSLGESPNALRQRLFRARRVLARHYHQLGGQSYALVSPRRHARRVGIPPVSQADILTRITAPLAVAAVLLSHSSVAGPARVPAPEVPVRVPASAPALLGAGAPIADLIGGPVMRPQEPSTGINGVPAPVALPRRRPPVIYGCSVGLDTVPVRCPVLPPGTPSDVPHAPAPHAGAAYACTSYDLGVAASVRAPSPSARSQCPG